MTDDPAAGRPAGGEDGAALIGVDWGSTRLRAYRIAADGAVLDQREGADGVKSVPPGGHAAVLARHLDGWPERRILLGGMVTSRGGWVETPYVPCPADAAQVAGAAIRRREGGRDLRFLAGVSLGEGPAITDVMRGEEVQIFGLGAAGPALVVLPGTHSKWARIEAGRVAGFRTFMTGELYDLVLRRSLAGALAEGEAPDEEAFASGVREGAATGAPAAALFSARPRVLAGALPPSGVAAFLSGLLIGNEVREADLLLGAPGGDVALLGAPELQDRYARALSILGRAARLAPPDAAATGFARLARHMP